MKQKYRIIKKNNRYHVQYKSINTFYLWSKIDYFYELKDAEECFSKCKKSEVIKESEWI